jgi:hypothetical protein
MRVLVVVVTAAAAVLGAAVPGAAAQTGFTGFEASSTGLISEEGFVTLGTAFECATETNGATVWATLEQQHAAGTSTASTSGGVYRPNGGSCAPGGAPLALGFAFTEGPRFAPGRATLTAQACVGSECERVRQTVELRDGGRTLAAPVPPGAQSLAAFGVVSTAVLETSGAVTVGSSVSCAAVKGPSLSGTLEQRRGKRIAAATASDFSLAGCGGGLAPFPASFIPVDGSEAFKPGPATISVGVCAGRTADFDCATLDGRIRLVKAK